MKFSTHTRYAIRVLLELSKTNEPVSMAKVSEETGIALRTVEAIHTVLKEYQVTGSTIGAKGGIYLETPLKEISLGLVVLLFDDGIEFSVCCGERTNLCPNRSECGVQACWNTISLEIQEYLNGIFLEDIFISDSSKTSFGNPAFSKIQNLSP